MLNKLRQGRGLAAVCALFVLFMSVQPAAYADMVSTGELIAAQQLEIDRNNLLAALDRDEVKQVLVQQGVSPDQAKERVANMTDMEVAQLNKEIEELPAGGVLGTILVIMVILLLTDLAGWTDVYPRI